MKWITRERIKVDRVACPWLIRNFIDPEAEFVFLSRDTDWSKIDTGILFDVPTTGTLWCLVLAWFASAFSERLRMNATIGRSISGTAGALFIFLGIRPATARR